MANQKTIRHRFGQQLACGYLNHFPTIPFLFFLVVFLGSTAVSGQTNKSTAAIRSSYDRVALEDLIRTLRSDAVLKNQEKALWIKKSVGARLPANKSFLAPTLSELGPDGTPLYYETLDKIPLAIAQNRSIAHEAQDKLGDGTDMRIGIWDQGAPLQSHQEFDNRILLGDSTKKTGFRHPTLVAGALISSGVKKKAKGLLPAATGIAHDWLNDRLEAAQMAAEGLLLSNHSYGIKPNDVPDWYFGSYITMNRQWDEIMYLAPYYIPVFSSGNSQRKKFNDSPLFGTAENGWDTLLGISLSKNGITVGSASTTTNTQGHITAAEVSPYSSYGPTDDGRIKPDLAYNGNGIYVPSGPGDKEYYTSSGTSIASAKVSGFLLLFQQYHEKLYHSYVNAATLKGLALHTSYDVGSPGPDYKMGWGILNPTRAANVIHNKGYNTLLLERTLKRGEVFRFEVNATALAHLEASLSWTDPANTTSLHIGTANSPSPMLVHDLDIRIFKDHMPYYPWVLDPNNPQKKATKGDNHRDNYEKVTIENPSGTYSVEISHKNNLQTESQHFSLIITGVRLSDCAPQAPRNAVITHTTENTTGITWAPSGQDALYLFKYRERSKGPWIEETLASPSITLQDLSYDAAYEFKISANCTANVFSSDSALYSFTFLGDKTALVATEQHPGAGQTNPFPAQLITQPVTDAIVLHHAVSNPSAYAIYNVSGQLLQQGTFTGLEIGLPPLNNGIYILALQHQNYQKSILFSKQ